MINVGMIGTGAMGAAMAANFSAGGYAVIAFDIDPARLASVATGSIRAADSVAALAAASEIVVSMLPDDSALADVAAQLAAAETVSARIFVDLSTTSATIASEIVGPLAARGITFLDGSVINRGVEGIKRRTSEVLVSGDTPAYATVEPLLQTLGHVEYVGKLGSAKILKIINNLLVAENVAITAEALRIGEAAGVDLSVLLRALRSSSGDSYVLGYFERYNSSGSFGEGLISTRYIIKDVALACALAADNQFPLLFGELTRQLYLSAANLVGPHTPFPSIYHAHSEPSPRKE